MSGTNSTATTPSGVPISSLPAASEVAPSDGVFGVFGGDAKLADPKILVAAGLPDDVVKTDDLDKALSSSALSQYTDQAAQHAADAKTGAAQSQTGAAAAAVSAGQAAQTGVQVATILVSAEDAASRASLSEAAASVNASSAEQVAIGAGKALAQNIALTASALNNPKAFTVRGAWNAATNTPVLTSSTGHEGDVYIVTTAGTTILDGEADWSLLDGVWFNGRAWVRLDRAGYPAIARLFAAVESVIIGATTMTEASGGRSLEIADVLGNILAYIDGVGNFRTGGTSVSTANFSLGTDSSWLLRIADFLGFTVFGVDATGAIKCPAGAVAPDLGLLRFEVVDDGKTGVIWQDRLGFMVLDTTPPVSIISDVFTAAEIAAHDQDNKNYAARVLACGWPTGMRPTADYNIAMNLGQSEENGEMSLPLLSTAQPYDNLMLGNSVRCSDPNPTETEWQPVGTATLNPLIASAWNWQTNSPIVRPNTMENTCTPKQLTIAPDGNATVITTTDESVDFTKVVLAGESIQFSGLTGDNAQFNMAGTEVGNQTGMNGRWYYMQVSDVTAHSITVNQAMVASADVSGVTIAWYAPVEPSLGEDNLVASLNYERAQDMYRSPTRKLVGVSTAVGGQSIAQLSKGATPDLFGRNAQAVTAVMTAAGQSASVAVHVGLFGQGGSDLDAPYADYLTKFTQYVADWRNAVMDVTGQVREPFFEWFVLSGGNIQSGPNDTMGVSCAQVDAFRKNLITNGYCVGPGYWSPDYYAHWSANGERWFANMRAKVRNRVIYRGEGWQPMHIREVLWRDNVLLVKFHVPIPPIQTAKCWVGQVYKMLDDLGFTVWENGTGEQIGIAHCDVVADTVLQITLGSVPASAPRIAYALWTNEGMGTGNLCDSDPTIAFDNYVWVEGMPCTENEPSLVGKPYPLMNWCCPYSLIATPA